MSFLDDGRDPLCDSPDHSRSDAGAPSPQGPLRAPKGLVNLTCGVASPPLTRPEDVYRVADDPDMTLERPVIAEPKPAPNLRLVVF